MVYRALTLAAYLATATAAPLTAQQAPPDEGIDLIERGAGILFRHMLEQMAPEIEGLGRDLDEAMQFLGPVVSDLAALVDDMDNYQSPERQENGDIIIRRRPGAPPPPPLGEGLKRFTTPEGTPNPAPFPDPNAPEIAL